jgi:membrane protease YdiL (CAAX protease family)
MSTILKREILALRDFIANNRNEILVVSLATLFLILARYHPLEPRWVSYVVWYLGLPVLCVAVVLRRNPLDFGLRLGNYKLWLVHVALACSVSLVLIIVASRFPSVTDYYSKGEIDVPRYIAAQAALLFSLEFFYRGFLLFGVKERFGGGAVLVQMIPFAILHIGKPEVEAVGCVLSGAYFGYVAYRTGSVWPVFLIHLFVNVANKLVNGG